MSLHRGNRLWGVRVKDMEMLILLSKGYTQTKVGEIIGIAQPHVGKTIRKIGDCYDLKITEGSKSDYRLSKEGLALAAQFEIVVGILQGNEDEIMSERIGKLTDLKRRMRDIVDLAESI